MERQTGVARSPMCLKVVCSRKTRGIQHRLPGGQGEDSGQARHGRALADEPSRRHFNALPLTYRVLNPNSHYRLSRWRRAVHRPRGLGRSLLARVSFAERGLAEFALATYHIQHVDAITVVTVEDPAAWLNDLAIAPATQFLWFRATVRVSDQTGRARSSSASVPQSSPWSKRGGSGLCFTERMRPELHTSCPLGCTDPKL